MYCAFNVTGYHNDLPWEFIVDMLPFLVQPTEAEVQKRMEQEDRQYGSWHKFYGDFDRCVAVAHKHGFGLEVPFIKESDKEFGVSMLELIYNKLTQFSDALLGKEPPPPEQLFNEKVEVHMPGHSLSTYDEVDVLYDQCTHSVQYKLDEGWRILAVCPQPDQRRPDYIIARRRPTDG